MTLFDKDMAAAAITYLALYVFALAVNIYILYQRGFKTRFTLIAIVCVIRIGAQLSGVGFSVEGYDHYQWLIAYLILGAEGYFSIVLAAYHFVAVFEKYVAGSSFLRPNVPIELQKLSGVGGWFKRTRWHTRNDFSVFFHYMLIPANAILIAGGTLTIGIEAQDWNTSSRVKAGKIMRIVGQSIFLVGCVFLLSYAARLRLVRKLKGSPLTAVLLAGPPLLVRGAFGIISAVMDEYNYYDFSNYTESGIKTRFLVGEYLMGTTMEYLATAILLLSHFTSFSASEMRHANGQKQLQRTRTQETEYESTQPLEK